MLQNLRKPGLASTSCGKANATANLGSRPTLAIAKIKIKAGAEGRQGDREAQGSCGPEALPWQVLLSGEST